MSHDKSVERLSETRASVGGAMATWPLRTLWWTCRTERTAQTVNAAVSALLEKDIGDLDDLEELADRVGVDPSDVRESRDVLEATDPDEIRGAVNAMYERVYGGPGTVSDDMARPESTCPYEREGSDMACHRCPVAGAALTELKKKRNR